METSGLPSIILPSPPQWLVASPKRTTGRPLITTVPLPAAHFQVSGPQQERCTPGSPMRKTGFPLMDTFGEPDMAGPVTLCEQHFLP
jgi:hypothetical protein